MGDIPFDDYFLRAQYFYSKELIEWRLGSSHP
jgi:hypothetical protein